MKTLITRLTLTLLVCLCVIAVAMPAKAGRHERVERVPPNCEQPASNTEKACCERPSICGRYGFEQPTDEQAKQAQQKKYDEQVKKRTGYAGVPEDELRTPDCSAMDSPWDLMCCNDPSRCRQAGLKQPTAAQQAEAVANRRTPNCEDPRSSEETNCCRKSREDVCYGRGFTLPVAATSQPEAQPAAATTELPEPNCDAPGGVLEQLCCQSKGMDQEADCRHAGFKVPASAELREPQCDTPGSMIETMCCTEGPAQERDCATGGFKVPQ
ncbi:MAG: hypothetical protein QNJ73_04370 [Gammaproteobacteria bacterium]|nr:hypothetical protein [Gammaproteobacteria bacterium]